MLEGNGKRILSFLLALVLVLSLLPTNAFVPHVHAEEEHVHNYVAGEPMHCTIDGVLRGLIATGAEVKCGMKCGDVDPRGKIEYCYTVSDKALAVGGGVLEAALHLTGILKLK